MVGWVLSGAVDYDDVFFQVMMLNGTFMDEVIKIHPKGNRNVCTTFHGNPPNICHGLSLRTTDVDVMVALEVKSHQSH